MALGLLSVPLLALVSPGCSSSGSKPLGPQEQIQYKQLVVSENADALTPEQKNILLFYPGRTEAEIDAALEQMIEYNERLREASEARIVPGERRSVYGVRSPYILQPRTGGASPDSR